MMDEMLLMKENGDLTEEELIWFNTKTTEELYDCEKDSFNLHNLANDPAYSKELVELRTALFTHLQQYPDLGQIPEAELIDMMWPNKIQPTTLAPKVEINNAKVELSSTTKGASIAYLIADNANEKFDYNSHWKLYTKPFTVKKGLFLYVISERIGYKESEIMVQQIN
jgi:hypothetical protein